MRGQVIYIAENLDFEATYEKISSIIPSTIRERAGRKPQVEVGAISFKLPSTNISVLIFPKGPRHKIQVVWKDIEEKETYKPKLISLLAPLDPNKPVTLTSLHMNAIKVPFPGPLIPNWPWCDEKYNYSKVNFNHLPKSERETLNLEAECFELLFKMFHQVKEEPGSLFGTPVVLIHKS